jgi:hypothetical protein
MLKWFQKRNDGPNFQAIMYFAEDMAQQNPRGLIDIVRALLRPLQAELLISAIENIQDATTQPH